MMKSLVLVVLLAVAVKAAVFENKLSGVVEVPDETDKMEVVDQVDDMEQLDEVGELELFGITDRRNLTAGTTAGLPVFNREVRANAIANLEVYRNVPVNIGSLRITGIRVNRIGPSQDATPTIALGGIGFNHVTIRITSARGRGFHYRVIVYAR
ncbi:hypothetical protein PYW08_009241 [Mythimna loreyi]|uniref:Uncharacterized protein n=1 Tax=Mythimna loreyi TaxID=667449 RepID=A0ACC2Q8W9_9NEOP|nr:hypothetical protein PYW08_009241 [Mythimna loreyi]